MKLTGVEFHDPVHLLVYGDPKVGKSTLVSQLAEPANGGFKLWWLSFDRGHAILKKLSPAGQENVELFIIPDTRDYPVAVDVVRELWKMKPVDICWAHGKAGCSVCRTAAAPFSTLSFPALGYKDILVIDNASQLSDSYMSLVTKGKAVDYKLQLDDYGAHLFHMKKLFIDIQQANFNIICIAHAVEEETTDKSKRIMPAIGSSSFAPKVAGYFDHVVYCHAMNKSHRFGSATTYINNVISGSRTDVKIEDMTVPDPAKAGSKIPAPSLLPFMDGQEKKSSVAPAASSILAQSKIDVSDAIPADTVIITSGTNAAEVKQPERTMVVTNVAAPAAEDDSPSARARRLLLEKARKQLGKST